MALELLLSLHCTWRYLTCGTIAIYMQASTLRLLLNLHVCAGRQGCSLNFLIILISFMNILFCITFFLFNVIAIKRWLTRPPMSSLQLLKQTLCLISCFTGYCSQEWMNLIKMCATSFFAESIRIDVPQLPPTWNLEVNFHVPKLMEEQQSPGTTAGGGWKADWQLKKVHQAYSCDLV